jgi:hypothetical protein
MAANNTHDNDDEYSGIPTDSDYSSTDSSDGDESSTPASAGLVPYAFESEYTPEELAERDRATSDHDDSDAMEIEGDSVPLDDEGHEDRTRMAVDE